MLTLYSLTSGLVVSAVLSYSNVLLEKIGVDLPQEEKNSDTINSLVDWNSNFLNAIFLFVLAYANLTGTNIVMLVCSTFISIVSIVILYRLPERSNV